jgi:hypothetical protein
MEDMRFQVSLDPPSHGWLGVSINFFEHGLFECAASDTPNDFLGELTYAMYRTLQLGERVSAFAHVEPGAYEFAFSVTPPHWDVLLEIIEHDELLQGSLNSPGRELFKIGGDGCGRNVCRAFLDAIEKLQRASGSGDFRSRNGWAWSFPDAGLYNIKLLLDGWPSDGAA